MYSDIEVIILDFLYAYCSSAFGFLGHNELYTSNNLTSHKIIYLLISYAEINRINQMKSDLLYELVDSSNGFYW